MIIKHMFIFYIGLLISASTVAPSCSIGTWDLKASDETILRFEINTTSSGTTAIWERPERFRVDIEGEKFSNLSSNAVRRSAQSVRLVNGDVELSFDDPEPNSIPDIFVLKCVEPNRLKVDYQGIGLEPFDFVRAQTDQLKLGPWDTKRTYVREIVRPTSSEMTNIFDADQVDRNVPNIDWSVVDAADKKRRSRTEELLKSGALQSGDDYYHAAFVFQHGSEPDDYLKAHLLAMIAVARGKSQALWIASATLDRYLLNTGKPQVLGTQFMSPKNAPTTQEPYDRALVSDTMRKALRVPSLSEQEAQRIEYTKKNIETKQP
jgi:hypothetical protein